MYTTLIQMVMLGYSSPRTRLSLPRGRLDLDQGLCCLLGGARTVSHEKVDHTKPQLQSLFVPSWPHCRGFYTLTHRPDHLEMDPQ